MNYYQEDPRSYFELTDQQKAIDYLRGLSFMELDSIKAGDFLGYGCYAPAYVVSNETHFFSGSGTTTTLTVLKWLVQEINEPVFKVFKEDPLPYKGSALKEYVIKVYTKTPKENIEDNMFGVEGIYIL